MVRIPMNSEHGGFPHVVGSGLLALGACCVALLSGLAAGLTYITTTPEIPLLGWSLQQLRPIHESSAFAWMFLGGVTMVYVYLWRKYGSLSKAMIRRLYVHNILWFTAGIGILWTLGEGHFTGREYIGYHPVFSLLILSGWILFSWNFFSCVGFQRRDRPIYIYMWSVAIVLFMISYLEGHLYLLDLSALHTVRDIAIQWKSSGTLVGAFNLLVYGTLMYLAGTNDKNESYARSNMAFALFAVGLLNTFTNYGHHTYHLPQSAWVHWTSFVVSMLEVILLAKVLWDIIGTRVSRADDEFWVSALFLRSATFWTFFMLSLSLAISIPPLNALIHGTHVVVAHSMGSMIGIDTMILAAGFAFLVANLGRSVGNQVTRVRVSLILPLINGSLVVFWLAFMLRGLAAGWTRYAGSSAPDLSLIEEYFPPVMMGAGIGLTAGFLWICVHWMLALIRSLRLHRLAIR